MLKFKQYKILHLYKHIKERKGRSGGEETTMFLIAIPAPEHTVVVTLEDHGHQR